MQGSLRPIGHRQSPGTMQEAFLCCRRIRIFRGLYQGVADIPSERRVEHLGRCSAFAPARISRRLVRWLVAACRRAVGLARSRSPVTVGRLRRAAYFDAPRDVTTADGNGFHAGHEHAVPTAELHSPLVLPASRKRMLGKMAVHARTTIVVDIVRRHSCRRRFRRCLDRSRRGCLDPGGRSPGTGGEGGAG